MEAIEAENAKRFLSYNPHQKQLAFHAAGKIARERLFRGGNKTGKTYSSSAEASMHITGNYSSTWNGYVYEKPIDAWAVGPSSALVRDVLQKYYIGNEEKGTIGHIHPSLIIDIKPSKGVAGAADTVYVRHASGGVSKLVFKNYGSGRELGREKFQGDIQHLIHIDEECPMPIYQECRMRIMATSPGFHGMMLLSMTPLKGQTALVSYFSEDRYQEVVKDSKWYITASWDDNPHLSEEERKDMLSGMTEQEKEARMYGIPWAGAGLVYPLPEPAYLVDDFEIPDHWPRAAGMDFGWTNPTALVFGAHDKNNDVVYIYQDYAVCENTPNQHFNSLLRFGVDWMPIVYDPAGKSSQQTDGEKLVPLYKKAGMSNMHKAENDRQLGILTVLQRLRAGQLKIFKSCKKVREEIQKYSYKENGTINDKDDHAMDAMRYYIMSGLKLAVAPSMKDIIYQGRYGYPQRRGPTFM